MKNVVWAMLIEVMISFREAFGEKVSDRRTSLSLIFGKLAKINDSTLEGGKAQSSFRYTETMIGQLGSNCHKKLDFRRPKLIRVTMVLTT